jgi:putative ABC transport system permease protein
MILETSRRFRRPLGFSFRNLYTVRLDAEKFADQDIDANLKDKTLAIIQSLTDMPNVVSVTAMSVSPFELAKIERELTYEGTTVVGEATDVTDGGQRTLDLRIKEGRWFDASDDSLSWTPVVINELMAERLFGDTNPLGRTVRTDLDWRVVGVVEYFRLGGKSAKPSPCSIRRSSFTKQGDSWVRQLVVKVKNDYSSNFEELAFEQMRLITPEWTYHIEPTERIMNRTLRIHMAPFIIACMVGVFLVIMVLLGMIGVFWQSVTGRIDEIGLRRAMGASCRAVYFQLIGEIILVTTLGIFTALFFIFQIPLLGVSHIVAKDFGAALGMACLSMYIIALASGLYPAWIASRVEPAQALHYE